MKKLILIGLLFVVSNSYAQPYTKHNLKSDKLAERWDEAMPLGNGMVGALVWQKDDKLRLSLDRADLWDERQALDLSKFDFKWVEEMVKKKDYAPVQKLGDNPYGDFPYPTKLPAAALEFDMDALGVVSENELDLKTAINTIKFKNGIVFKTFVHATMPVGFFELENVKEADIKSIKPEIKIHAYNSELSQNNESVVSGSNLAELGYPKGTLITESNNIRYHQDTYDNNFFEVVVRWKKSGKNKLTGIWLISKNTNPRIFKIDEKFYLSSHIKWWENYWSKSSINLPDSLLEKQYYLEMYKFGSVARKGSPAITLQAVWTADNGKLPPWKGDFHNDLNTQLSYWPAYTGNRLEEATSYIGWLENIKKNNYDYTKQYFGVEGLNVPGVATLNGHPMGGWIQYAMSPTVGAWCAQHYYWQWKYAMDSIFLAEKAYPYVSAVAEYLLNITRVENGIRKLPLSSSPEYNHNNLNAWFTDWTNFDLSLAKFTWKAAKEMALLQNKKDEAEKWTKALSQLPFYEVNETGFTVAPGQNLNESHRHFSQYMAIYPLALLDINRKEDGEIIKNSIARIEEMGTNAWTGYSFSWMASIYARAYEAEKATKSLRIFATNFCTFNSFHVNGDQKGGEHSKFTYRPFTLEGNFAFAQGVHELLIQSREGYIEVFPATPKSWKNVSFQNLRTEGGFLVTASIKESTKYTVKVLAEEGGKLNIKLPEVGLELKNSKNPGLYNSETGIFSVNVDKGQKLIFKNY